MALKFRQFYKPKPEPEGAETEQTAATAEIQPQATAEGPLEVPRPRTEERSFAIFGVGPEWYAVDLDSIIEILHDFEIVSVPHLPGSFTGVTNLRGESVPIVNMQTLLRETPRQDSVRVCIVTLVRQVKIGFLADTDVEIIALDKGRYYSLPNCFSKEEAGFLEGIFWTDNRFIAVLKCEEALNTLTEWRSEYENK
jgi:purine-binding chemotaxis protein CheW